MKKRIIAAALALALIISIVPMVNAGFSDIGDRDTARNVAVLRLMGVIDGDAYGNFRPNDSLTRAEFCKMAVSLMGKGSEVLRYRNRTIFPDVRASHWAAGYINYAAASSHEGQTVYVSNSSPDGSSTSSRTSTSSTDSAIIHGQPDGTFAPDRAISFAEAVTILMRVIGFGDKTVDLIWPQGYLDLAEAKKLTKGVSLSADDTISRAQAAQLFVNALTTEISSAGVEYISTLGSVSSEVMMISVDLAKGRLVTSDATTTGSDESRYQSSYEYTSSTDADGNSQTNWTSTYSTGKNNRIEYKMDRVIELPELVGLKGRVVTKNGKVLTFLPSTSTSGKAITDAAIIVRANGSADGFKELTGESTDYTIYRNGVRILSSALKQYDIATYNADLNTVLVCDTRVAVYYEKCTPSPAAPTSITVLNTEFAVVPSAQQSLSRFKPGDNMTVLLTADGRIAGAVANDSGVSANAYAYVDGSGKVSLICGGALLALGCTDTAHAGKVGRISQSKQPFTDARIGIAVTTGGVGGTLDVAARRLGTLSLADNVMIISKGEILSLNELTEQTVSANRITNAHLNDSGVVDIIVIGDEVTVRGEIYGRVEVTGNLQITLNCGANGKESGRYILSDRTNTIKQGDFVAAIYNNNGLFHPIEPLTKFENVPASAWIGKTMVVAGGATYTVPESVLCWNKDLSTWFADFDTAFDYGGVRNLYVKDGVVRVIEISAR